MYKVTTIFERPNDSIPYYIGTQPELIDRFAEFTSNASELLYVDMLDETPTRQVTQAFYANEAAFNIFIEKYNTEFLNFFEERDAYHASVGITTSRTVTVEE
jgi:hypothetical protein